MIDLEEVVHRQFQEQLETAFPKTHLPLRIHKGNGEGKKPGRMILLGQSIRRKLPHAQELLLLPLVLIMEKLLIRRRLLRRKIDRNQHLPNQNRQKDQQKVSLVESGHLQEEGKDHLKKT